MSEPYRHEENDAIKRFKQPTDGESIRDFHRTTYGASVTRSTILDGVLMPAYRTTSSCVSFESIDIAAEAIAGAGFAERKVSHL